MKYSVKVHAGSKLEKIEITNDFIELWLRARAHDGEANARIIEILAKNFHVAKNQIKILKGLTSKNKIVEIN